MHITLSEYTEQAIKNEIAVLEAFVGEDDNQEKIKALKKDLEVVRHIKKMNLNIIKEILKIENHEPRNLDT